ncbi:hypothetical protein ACTSEZ_06335 [Metabacillus sp. JX24]|uniref:hypothetical protein n=1 Tax=Metabacillus sp. JX24 TaxID=3240759 RepID=UPI0035106A7C
MESVELQPEFAIVSMLNGNGPYNAPVLEKVNSTHLILTKKEKGGILDDLS